MTRRETPPSPTRAFLRDAQALGGGRHQIWRVFADFCELAALSLSQWPFADPAREARYLQVIGGYDRSEAATFARMLGHVINGLDADAHDFLGDVFQQLELSNHWRGQYFTPTPIARLMAEMQLADGAILADREFVTVSDPACGAGVGILAFAAALRARDIDPGARLYAHGQDVDETAARMCFIQLALCGIPATVVIGNTLALEARDVLLTPAHHLGFWDVKLRRRRDAERSVVAPATDRRGQLTFALGEVAA